MLQEPGLRSIDAVRRAAVAASLPLEVGGDAPALQGMAACFLPLPVATGLPVHVNGYFELSSNRRDIWCAICPSVLPAHACLSRTMSRYSVTLLAGMGVT